MKHRVLLSIILLLSSLPLFAQEESAEQAPSSSPSQVRWSLGLGVISSPRPYVGAKNSVLAFYRLTTRVNFVGLIRVQRLDNEISSSPIVDKPRGYFGLLGVNYTFGKLRGGPPADKPSDEKESSWRSRPDARQVNSINKRGGI